MKEQMKSSMASLLLTVSLVACSGNSNDSGSIRADLRNPSKEAALIELGQLRHLLVIRGSPFAPLSEAFQPGPVPVTDCSSGSVEATEVEAERRLMFYDGFDRTADVTVSRFDRCQADGSLQDHVVEMGEFQGFDPVNDPGDSFDSYAVFGDADGAYRLEVDGTIEDISGRVESRSSDIGVESAWVLSRTVERTSPEPYVLVWEQGAPGDPLDIASAPANIGWIEQMEGPYSWATSRCVGGDRRVQVAETITRSDSGYPGIGHLVISAGSASVSIRFENGAATAVFHDGTTIALTADEVQAALDNPIC